MSQQIRRQTELPPQLRRGAIAAEQFVDDGQPDGIADGDRGERLPRVARPELVGEGIDVRLHETVPANDGGISLGQAVAAAAMAG